VTRSASIIEAFVAGAEGVAAGPADLPRARRELLASILWRLNRLDATQSRARRITARLLPVRGEPELPETYPLRRVSPKLREIIDVPTVSPRSDKALVARVLRDL
jgi:hypothetical protein